jgi:cell wall assembly regulator SMI1
VGGAEKRVDKGPPVMLDRAYRAAPRSREIAQRPDRRRSKLTASMKQLWDRLEAWAKKNAKRSLRLSNKGVSEKRIAAAEKKMRLKIPSDLRASLLLHDGQANDDVFRWLPGCSPLRPLDAIVAQWKDEQENVEQYGIEKALSEDGLLHTTLWHPKRIPIAGTEWWDGDNTYIDLFPGPKGTAGQVMTFVSECDLEVLGPSLHGALELYLEALESGEWVYDKKSGDVDPKKDDDYGNASYAFAEWRRKREKKKPARKKTKKN